MERLVDFWEARDERERALLKLLVGVVVPVFFYVAVILPLASYHAAAARNLDAASREMASIGEFVRVAQTLTPFQSPAPVTTEAEFEERVRTVASQLGLSFERLELTRGGTITTWIEGAAPHALYDWISILAEQHGITVAQADIAARADTNIVRAQIRFEQGRGQSVR